MLTSNDIKLLVDNFVTREEFNQALNRIEEKMATKDDLNRVLNLVDEVLGEVKSMRIEQAAHFQQHEDIDKTLKIHSKKLQS